MNNASMARFALRRAPRGIFTMARETIRCFEIADKCPKRVAYRIGANRPKVDIQANAMLVFFS
jgi:hypothetical protein